MTATRKAPARTVDAGGAQNKIIAARTSLVLDQPFFGSLALSLKVQADPTCKTAWVDGRTLGYNPAFVNSLTHEQLTALVAHEVMHCAAGHPWRRDARDGRKWNQACDRAINSLLTEAGFTLPPDGLYAEGDEIGKSAEWIFGRRFQTDEPGDTPQPKPKPDGDEQGDDKGQGDGAGDSDEPGDGDSDGDGEPGDGDGNPGDSQGEVRDAPTGADTDGDEAPSEQEWKERVSAAATHAKMMGKLPGGMARAIAQALKPKVDVRSLLLRFFQERASADYSWTRPNGRYLAQGLYLPALHSQSLGEVAIMVDTSGSMDDVALAKAQGIAESVIQECNPVRVSMYYADADVQHVDHFEQGEPLEWPGKDTHIGGGGTDFRPALEAIERDETPVCVVCITDLCGVFPDVAPDVPVLWLSTDEYATAPFGETVYVDE